MPLTNADGPVVSVICCYAQSNLATMPRVKHREQLEMGNELKPPEDWTEPERWVWERIAAGEVADLNARDREQGPERKDLHPSRPLN